MALTGAEKLSCFEILRLSYASTGSVHDGFGVQLTLTNLDTIRNLLTTDLDGNTGTGILDTVGTTIQTKISALVVKWDALQADTIDIIGGGTTGIQGVNLSTEAQRNEIRKQLETYVPMMHIKDTLARKAGMADSQVRIV